MSLRLAFMGSPTFALPALEALLDADHEVACVYSQPPRPAGRGKQERQTPVHAFAASRGIEVRTPKSLKRAEEQETFAALQLDAVIVVAYGLILPKPVLEAPRLGAFNLHGSLLPRWRGAAPIQRAIMAGDRVTGVQVMRMEEGLDTGPVLATAETPIDAEDNSSTLHDRLAGLGAGLLIDTLDKLERGEARETPQGEEGVTYAHKITPAEARIDWTRPAREVDCMIRGLSPHPGAWFELGGARIKVLHSRLGWGEGEPGEALDDELLIACGSGAVRLLTVQREGRAPLAAEAYLRGAPVSAGIRLR
ncbi:methionyl-tRNA formyltransferase [Terricaulis silvestris]|uniref:Methionyl-tRNA formyltransferase n=1 Tax=Terricaulis silvestris TaxID=2686094 RepID=A0A6I6MM80_9CAUL|nr:methionyl-tRNA formyltransferase [Terricaulis silvestris]QGZ94428.1 Methionyl-tRNA formyltransferase [Terricaulis silvestris]